MMNQNKQTNNPPPKNNQILPLLKTFWGQIELYVQVLVPASICSEG